MEIKSILIIGAGTMGSGIAQCIAEHGMRVFILDSNPEIVKRAVSKISERLQRTVDSGEITSEHKKEIFERIRIVENLDQARDVDFVIEAIIEDIENKKNLFNRLDKIFSNDIVLASNTSSLSISEIAKSANHPERIAGMHFFNPAYKMKLVEVVKGIKTSRDTIEKTKKLANILEKIPVEVNDTPGFIVNRILIPMINEAAFALQDNVADKESIDTAMKLGAAHPIGPLALADLIGIDVCLHIMESLEKNLNNPRYKPCELLRQMVKENKLGRKTGQGFYTYKK
mgnify:FL=1